MSATRPGDLLNRAILAVLRQGKYETPQSDGSKSAGGRALAHAGIAIALLQAPAVGAVTLGALDYQTGVGQPFRATTLATISSGESLQPGCITSSPYKLGTLRLREPLQISIPATKIPGQYTIELATTKPLTEPMYELQLRVDCPGTAILTRSYIVMLGAQASDQNPQPAGDPVASTPVVAQPAAQEEPVLTQPLSRKTPDTATRKPDPGKEVSRSASAKSINPGENYRVSRGDTLFGIAARLNQRPAGATWAAARMLFDANQDAFINGDKNQLKLGSVLRIPSSDIIANLKADAGFDNSSNPSAPKPERNLPARPALVRSEESSAAPVKTTDQADRATDGADSPVPYAVEQAPLAKAKVTSATPQVTEPSNAPNKPAPVQQNAKTSSAPQQATGPKVSYPANEQVSPLLAGLIGMLLGALLATILFSGRRILDSLRRAGPSAAEANGKFNAFDTTDTLDVYANDSSLAAADPDITHQASPKAEANQMSPNELESPINIRTGKYPVSSQGTIEVEFSELNATEGRTLGFDLSDALAGATERPKLSESPRINLEGLGANFDLSQELREMLEDFNPAESDAAEGVTPTGVNSSPNDIESTQVDTDPDDTGEVTQPGIAENMDTDSMFNASQTALPPESDAQDDAEREALKTVAIMDGEAMKTLAIKPLSAGLDLDLDPADMNSPQDDLDFSLDAQTDAEEAHKKD